MGELLIRVFQRTGRNGQKTWTARFSELNGTIVKTLSLPQAHSKRQAERLAHEKLSNREVVSKDDPLVLDYLQTFWQSNSDYVGYKSSKGRKLSERYIYDCRNAVKVHLTPFLEGIRISQLTLELVDDWSSQQFENGVGARRINTALKALHVAVKYFCRRARQPNILDGLEPVVEVPKKRQLLSPTEMAQLSTVPETPRIRAAVLLAAFCGLRAGEIRGLQWQDVDQTNKCLQVRHNYVSDKEGVKLPKWQKTRTVPLPDVVAKALEQVAAENILGSPFVIFNEKRTDRPIERCTLTRGYYRLLAKMGITETMRKARNLCLHGLRHLFVSHSRSIGIPDFVVQRLAGHATLKMTDEYTEVTVTDFASALARLNGRPVPLRQAHSLVGVVS